MACEDKIVLDIQDALLKRVRRDDLVTWVDRSDEEAIFVVRKEQLLSSIKTTVDLSAECVVVFGREQLFLGNSFEAVVFGAFRCEYMIHLVELFFDEVDGCITVSSLKVEVGFSFFEKLRRNFVFFIFDRR